ncbi:MAG: PKD domain-containing protein [Aquaticitalea sp.]
MKTIIRLKKQMSQVPTVILVLVTCALTVSCDPSIDSLEYDLPEANSQADLTPPEAAFTVSVGDSFLIYDFANQSTSATSYVWDYGDGNTSTTLDGENTYAAEGTYTVTLTATDNLGVSSTVSEEIVVVEPEIPPTLVPDILEAGFENGNDSRDPWRNSDLGGVIQITTSNGYREGAAGAKLPASGDRIGYQLLGEFSPNKTYLLNFKYAFRDQDAGSNGSISVAMVQALSSIDNLEENTVAITTFTESATGVGVLVSGGLQFNSGANTSLAIFFFNDLDEAYIDSFELIALD